MAKPKLPCETLPKWLRDNLGNHCLAPLTGTDLKALMAAVQIIDLYSYERCQSVLEAFYLAVMCMQSTTQELAYHAIAHVMDWTDRATIWQAAGLPAITPRRCAFE